jgi:putative redox protein
MITKTTLQWKNDLIFEAEVNGYKIILDTTAENGGNESGPRPKPLLLAALSGCSGMDVVSILRKMKFDNFTYNIEIDADSGTEYPMAYHTIRMKHILNGKDLKVDKVIKAVVLSREQYCAVYAMLSKAAEIKVSVEINGVEVYNV